MTPEQSVILAYALGLGLLLGYALRIAWGCRGGPRSRRGNGA
jgi:hypothetical protein